MNELILASLSAIWLGILTSISPCPLATNIAAVAFVSKGVKSPRRIFLAGMAYTFGRALTYAVIASLLVASLLSAPYLSRFLQKYMNLLLGPVLIIVGSMLLELIKVNFSGSSLWTGLQKKAESWGLLGAGLLGIMFALSFCPISAALFFGSLIPVALQKDSGILLPALYGLGTALPVIGFSVLIALGAKSIGFAHQRLVYFELWARRITGGIFIAAGIYYSLKYIFAVL
jgi:cytochrome c-type biogenesis protein